MLTLKTWSPRFISAVRLSSGSGFVSPPTRGAFLVVGREALETDSRTGCDGENVGTSTHGCSNTYAPPPPRRDQCKSSFVALSWLVSI